jgi:hypothetical protein
MVPVATARKGGVRDKRAGRTVDQPSGAVDDDDRRTVRLYWAGVALTVAGLFASKLLPCVDYPQHLALSDVARRLADPAASEHVTYELNLLTYNGLFHVTVARLSAFLPIELAGRTVVAGSLLATAAGVLALLRTLRRPVVHAALFTPILFSFSVGWGFVNYVMATAIAVWVLVFVARAALRPSAGAVLAVAGLGLLCAFAHVLAMLVLCLAAAALGLELAWRAKAPPAGAPAPGLALRILGTVLRASLAVGPLVLACVYCILVYQRQYVWDPNMYRDPTMEGTAPALWEKVVYFSAYATDLFDDGTDQVILWLGVAVMTWSLVLRAHARRAGTLRPEPSPPIVAPFVALTVAYFATPMVAVGTHLVFPRLAQWWVLSALLALPRFPAEASVPSWKWMTRLGLAAGLNTLLHCALFGWETNDASAMIDDLPPGRAATAVIWDPWTHAFRNGTLTHLAAYYAARKHGHWAFAFARYLSVPVRFKPGTQPAWPARGWEFSAEDYDPRCKYARAFPLVLIKASDDVPTDGRGETFLRRLVFRQDATAVKLLSHHGRYWAFDTTGLPDDGTL